MSILQIKLTEEDVIGISLKNLPDFLKDRKVPMKEQEMTSDKESNSQSNDIHADTNQSNSTSNAIPCTSQDSSACTETTESDNQTKRNT